jgi:hypothetical protein
MPNYYGNTSIGPDTKPNYDYATQNENLRGNMDPYFELNDINPSGLLRKLGGKYLGGLAAGAIIPGKKIPGVFQGKLKGFAGNPNASNRLDAEALHMADKPFAVGNIDKLPLDNKGSYSAFLNPDTGNMAYTEALHSHRALEDAALTYMPDMDQEGLYGKLRRIAYQGLGGEKGVTHVTAPYRPPTRGVAAASALEDSYIERMIKMLESKGLNALGEEYRPNKMWNMD